MSRPLRFTTSLSTDQAYAVLRAGSAVAALAVLDADAAVDVLLTDFAMPGMDGLALIAAARRRRPGLAALLIGNVGGEVEARLALDGMAGGAFTLLRKPVRAAQLSKQDRTVACSLNRPRRTVMPDQTASELP